MSSSNSHFKKHPLSRTVELGMLGVKRFQKGDQLSDN